MANGVKKFKMIDSANQFLIRKKGFIAFGIASLVGFLLIDILISNFFIKDVQFISLDFFLNILMLILLILVYYALIIQFLAGLIEKILDKYKRRMFWIVVATLIIFGILFHSKYNLFDPLVSKFFDDNFPWIKNFRIG